MDVNLLTAAHRIPENQLRFDQEVFDGAALSFEKRLSHLRSGWKRLETQIFVVAGYLLVIAKLATSKRTQLG